MRITILGTAYPFRGGLATFNERLARQFQQEGHKVKVVTFTLQYPSFLFPGKTQFSNEEAPDDLSIERRLSSVNPLTWISLGKEIRRDSPDILICCYWMAFMAPAFGTVSRLASGNGHTKCIALVHNMFPHEKGLLNKVFSPYFTSSQSGFVALSESVVRDISSLSPDTPKACSPHPVYDHYGERLTKEEACSYLGLDPKDDYMLFFGLVRKYKGLDLLIQTFAKVKDSLPCLKLLVAGEFYDDEKEYRAMIDSLGLADRVIVRNEFIEDALLKYYFGACSLVAQPYRSATQSGVTQVAFHFEKPMLVTNVGGLAEIVHHGKMGYAVSPDPSEIAEALLDYYTHEREPQFTDYLRQEKGRYSWSRLTSAFFTIFEK